ncbi:hypothetical protein ACS0TY_017301 [Phlomoides rotata]
MLCNLKQTTKSFYSLLDVNNDCFIFSCTAVRCKPCSRTEQELAEKQEDGGFSATQSHFSMILERWVCKRWWLCCLFWS